MSDQRGVNFESKGFCLTMPTISMFYGSIPSAHGARYLSLVGQASLPVQSAQAESLRHMDRNRFKTVHVCFDAIEWDNGADICPEALYENSRPADERMMVAEKSKIYRSKRND